METLRRLTYQEFAQTAEHISVPEFLRLYQAENWNIIPPETSYVIIYDLIEQNCGTYAYIFVEILDDGEELFHVYLEGEFHKFYNQKPAEWILFGFYNELGW